QAAGPKLENCRLEAVNVNVEGMNVFSPYATAVADDALIRNTVLSFSGRAPTGVGPGPDAHFRNNAYRLTRPVPAGYFVGDPGAVVVDDKLPPAGTPPPQGSP